MSLNVYFNYWGLYVGTADQAVSLSGGVVDGDPSDNLNWLALLPDVRPTSITYTLAGNDIIQLTGSFSDFVQGELGDDQIFGGGGNDTLSGGAGDDMVMGDDGIDTVGGGAGDDVLFGGAGNDILDGSNGSDSLNGDEGDDFLDGYVGDDSLNGGTGDDTMLGRSGGDWLKGQDGDDIGKGGGGDDEIYGDAGNDTLDGGLGNDSISGDDGNDTLRGSLGNDALTGGRGQDRLTGGGGGDEFDYAAVSDSTSAAFDTITDFQPGIDVIDMSAIDAKTSAPGNDGFRFLGVASAFTAAGQIRLVQQGADTLVLFNTNSTHGIAEMTIVLAHTDAKDVSAGDFVL